MSTARTHGLLLPILGLALALSTLTTHAAEGTLEQLTYGNPDLVVDLGVGLWAYPMPIDYDNDGDPDLLVSCPDKPYNGTYFFENPGGGKLPVFKPGKRLGPGYHSIQISHTQDGPRVMIPGRELPQFQAGDFKTAEAVYPERKVHKDAKKIRANQWKWLDYDHDGDLDLTVGVGDWTEYGWDDAYNDDGKWTNGPLHGYVYWIENTSGSNSNPEWGTPEQLHAGHHPIDVYGKPTPNFADWDGDGDLDLICGSFVDSLTYFKNIGTREAPEYARGTLLRTKDQRKRYTMDLCMIVPVAYDWDGDGDVDLIVGEEDGRVALVENTGDLHDGVPLFNDPVHFQQEAHYVKFGALATPFGVDWDQDGDEDLICGNTAGYIAFIENLDGGDPPHWAEPVYLTVDGEPFRVMAGYNGSIQGPAEAKWGYTTQTVIDWDGDGLLDIVYNSIWGKVEWLRNVGTAKEPQLAPAQPVRVQWADTTPKPAWNWWTPEHGTLSTQWRTTPFTHDLNEDGLPDLIMLDHEGYLAYFERTTVDGERILQPGQRIFKDADGNPLRLNEREAGKSGRRKLCLADWDGDGRLDLIVNSRNATLYRNTSDDPMHPVYEDAGEISETILAGHTSSPTTVDWDHNGIPDLLIGAEDGHFYYQHNPRASGE